MDAFWTACADADMVVSSSSGFASPYLADTLGVPHCWALLQPMSPTRAFPHFLTPAWLRLPSGLNRQTYRIAEHTYARLFRQPVDRWLSDRRIRPPARPDPRGYLGASPGRVLYGISRHVLPPAPDWPATVALCGYWMLEPPPGWAPPDALAAFLDSGPPPVYVHLSRMTGQPAPALLAIIVAALVANGQRGVVCTGADLPAADLPDTVLLVPAVPHAWMMPRAAAAVHHGGAGTTAQALRAGIPALGVPSFYDQPFWSHRVAALGAGPDPVPGRRLTARRLRSALARMTGDPVMRARAQALGAALREESGIGNAVALLSSGGTR
jgi:sterol 3beta-glucosyltransferase